MRPELRPELRRELEADEDGLTVLVVFDEQLGFTPPPHVKSRLQRQFGIYPGRGTQPFGPHHFVGGPTRSPSEVRMISSDAFSSRNNSGKLPNFLVNMLSKTEPPTFSGHATDWKTFWRRWNDFRRLIQSLTTDQISEEVWLELFKLSLDDASKGKIEARKERDPSYTCAQFWKELCTEFGYDLTTQYRDEWRKVTLRGPNMQAWREYQAQFEKAIERVSNLTSAKITKHSG